MSGYPPYLFRGRRFAVVGLGRNGLAAARSLGELGAEVVAWDDQPAARTAAMAAGIRVVLPAMSDLDALVLSPGIPHALPSPHPLAAAAAAAHVPILSDAELLFAAVRAAGSRARFAGITGTNGKSTTTALLAHILAVAGVAHAAGGNLGPAALALPFLTGGVYVLEMSSYMLERLAALRFDAAAMLNLSLDHIDRHGSMAGYAAAKRAIFDRQEVGDCAVVGIDDDESRALAAGLPRRPLTVSGAAPADFWCADGVLRDAAGVLLDLREAPALPGSHNAQNAAAAAALALALGVSRQAVAQGIASYPGLPHRQQVVGEIGGIRFVNDSKATNADATGRALACYEHVVWIAGGIGKAGGIASLAPYFPRIAEALLIGRDAPLFAATLAAAGVPHRVVGSLAAAVPEAAAAARRAGAEAVLLSPAAASFDQFTGFEQRGEQFVAAVRALVQAPLREVV